MSCLCWQLAGWQRSHLEQRLRLDRRVHRAGLKLLQVGVDDAQPLLNCAPPGGHRSNDRLVGGRRPQWEQTPGQGLKGTRAAGPQLPCVLGVRVVPLASRTARASKARTLLGPNCRACGSCLLLAAPSHLGRRRRTRNGRWRGGSSRHRTSAAPGQEAGTCVHRIGLRCLHQQALPATWQSHPSIWQVAAAPCCAVCPLLRRPPAVGARGTPCLELLKGEVGDVLGVAAAVLNVTAAQNHKGRGCFTWRNKWARAKVSGAGSSDGGPHASKHPPASSGTAAALAATHVLSGKSADWVTRPLTESGEE